MAVELDPVLGQGLDERVVAAFESMCFKRFQCRQTYQMVANDQAQPTKNCAAVFGRLERLDT